VIGASLEVFKNAVSVGTTAVGGTGTWSLPLTAPLAAGDVITAQQTVAGVASPLSAPVTVQAALTRIEIVPAPTAALNVGQSLQFSARGTFSDASIQDPLVGAICTPEEVWQAIATGPGVSSWFVPTEAREDGTVVSHFGPGMDSVATRTAWEPPHRFVDVQRHGPYRLWIHEHRFEPHNGGTLVQDNVQYAAPRVQSALMESGAELKSFQGFGFGYAGKPLRSGS
jgi:ligand-binding SRPBCC domain-containing protein